MMILPALLSGVSIPLEFHQYFVYPPLEAEEMETLRPEGLGLNPRSAIHWLCDLGQVMYLPVFLVSHELIT